jgi:hypothetical protein
MLFPALILMLCSFRKIISYDTTRDGIYAVRDAKGKGHGWLVQGDPDHPDQVNFLRPHQTEIIFSATMVDATHFKTKTVKPWKERSSEYAREYDAYGQFIDTATLFLHVSVKRTHLAKKVVQDTSYEYTYLKLYKHESPSGYPDDSEDD